jgi:hypothetical protein
MTTALEIEKLLNDYRVWLKDKTTLREVTASGLRSPRPTLTVITTRCKSTLARKTAGTFSPMTAIQFTISKRPAAISVRKSDKTS